MATIFKKITSTLSPNENTHVFTDSLINNNSVIELYCSDNDVYPLNVTQSGAHSISVEYSEHSTEVTIAITINNATTFEPYDDTDVLISINELATDKQDKLTAGQNIVIDENNVISSTGGSGGGSTVNWSQTYSLGEEIAKITIDGITTTVKAPSVAFSEIDELEDVVIYPSLLSENDVLSFVPDSDYGIGYWTNKNNTPELMTAEVTINEDTYTGTLQTCLDGMCEHIENAENSFENVYSLDELRIGTFLGKPLYRKVYTTTASGISIATSKTSVDQYVTNKADIETIVNASVIRPTGVTSTGNFTSQGAAYIEDGAIKLYSGSVATSNITHFILEYTKKGDE